MHWLLHFFTRLHWNKLVPMLPLLVGFAACDLCGYGTRPDGTNRCTQFSLASYQGMPYGPVTIKWHPTDGIVAYTAGVYNDNIGWIGFTKVPPTETSAVVKLDPALVKKVMDTDRHFTIVGLAGFNAPLGSCYFNYPIAIPKAEAKQVGSPTPVPPPNTNPHPPQPPQPPTAHPTLPPPVFILPSPTLKVPR